MKKLILLEEYSSQKLVALKPVGEEEATNFN